MRKSIAMFVCHLVSNLHNIEPSWILTEAASLLSTVGFNFASLSLSVSSFAASNDWVP